MIDVCTFSCGWNMCAQYNRQDKLYHQAKADGYRSRAAYKLLEINKRFKIMNRGSRVFDLGCWPGGWLQIASQAVGDNGVVVGVDLVQVEPIYLDNVSTLQGDARDDSTIDSALAIARDKFDVLLSDMSPKLTGIREVDQAGTVGCAELALYVASQVLKSGGSFVAKVFKGSETDKFIRDLRSQFEKVVRTELDSTRKTSNEFYVIGINFKGNN